MNTEQRSGSLTERHVRNHGRDWRVAVVSLFGFDCIGVRAVYSFMKASGHDIDLIFLKEHAINRFDMPSEHERNLFMNILKDRDIRAVALSVRSPYMSFASGLTEDIHRELGIPVIWGGVAATLTPEPCLLGGADYAISGEGEEAFAELVTALATGADGRKIRNVWYKGPDGPVGNPLRPLIADLDTLPIPDLTDENKFYVEFGRLQEGDPWRKSLRYEIMASRGCPYSCTYCSNSVLHEIYRGLGRVVRLRSVEHVVRELEYAGEMMPNLGFVAFYDDVFGADLEWLREFKDAYSRRIGQPFNCASDPRSITEERIRLLKEAGACELQVGIQTGSERVRRELFNRHVSNEQILNVAHLMKRYGIGSRYDIIADNPFESPTDKRATLDLLMELPKPFVLNIFSLNHFPRTKLTELALAQRIISEDDVAGKSDRCLRQIWVSFDFPRPREDQCWNALFSLSSKRFIPRFVLRWMASSTWFMRHPLPAVVLARVSSLIRLFFDGTRLLFQGRIDLDWVRRFIRSIGSLNR